MTAPHEDVFGFYGTIKNNECHAAAEAQAAWECAMAAVIAFADGNATLARNFLRSRHGRHFADETSFYDGSLANRIRAAARTAILLPGIAALESAGYDATLFACDPASGS
jgi:hypothetical protein